MGCGVSSDSINTENVTPETSAAQHHRTINVDQSPRTILEAYQQFDEEICHLESVCPGPRLATMDTWVQYLETQRAFADKDVVQLPLHLLDDDEHDVEEEELKYDKQERLNNDVYAITKVRQLAEKLNVITDIQQAMKYEEFMASVSRRYMDDMTKMLRSEILEHAQKRASELMQQYTRLRGLYSEQDALIASMNGGNYTSANEQQMDEDLESARQIRDKLGGAAEQWRTAANLLRAGAKSALVANEQWNLINSSREPKVKIDLAIECRSSLLGSIVALKSAQEALPQVDIPHITQRQIVAVVHANEYLLTDIANIDRYQHSRRVFDVYHNSLIESIKWLHDVFKRTLKKDLDEAEDGVLTIAKKLRQYRVNFIQTRLGNKLYLPDGARQAL